MKRHPKIYCLTLSWNGLDKLKRLHPGLIQNLNATGLPWSWLIKDNGSTDRTIAEIKTWENVKVIETGHNRDNFSQGMNLLAYSCQEIEQNETVEEGNDAHLDYFLLLNNDVEFADLESVSNMVKLLESDPKIAVVGARLLYFNSNKIQHSGVVLSAQHGGNPWNYRRGQESNENDLKNRYFNMVTAAVCLVRCSDFFAVNGFDERFSWAFEDCSLCLEIGKLGKKIAYCGKTKIYHEESASLKKNPLNRLFLQQNVKLFKEKWKNIEIDHDKYLSDPNYNLIL